mmetsp:Transcript_34165/g.86743  ORF Transcript_34165/g.86743 Transcript_34165/m.86743 type:complete len:200 (+) Transcript_34165:32-631(+)
MLIAQSAHINTSCSSHSSPIRTQRYDVGVLGGGGNAGLGSARPTVWESGFRLACSSICIFPPLCGGSVSSQCTPQCTWRGAVRSHDFGLLERAIASPSSPLTQADGLLARAASDMGAREMGARDADAAGGAAAGSTADAGSWHAAVSPSALRRTSRSGMGEGMCSARRSWTSLRVSVYPAHEGSCRLLGRKAPTRLSRL